MIFRALASLALALGVAVACSVVGSEHVASPAATCTSSAGSYQLPKSLIHFEVAKSDHDVLLQNVRTIVVPDGTGSFCLDHLHSVTAHDKIEIKHETAETKVGDKTATTALPFLKSVAASSADQTSVIVRNFIRAIRNIAIVSLRAGETTKTAAVRTPDYVDEYDPFDIADAARVNGRLSSLGFCLVLSGFTLESAGATPERYCADPGASLASTAMLRANYAAYVAQPARLPAAGIYYKPRPVYQLMIFTNQTPGRRGAPWRLSSTTSVALENASPILRIDVMRSIFATSGTRLEFDKGSLTRACVEKTSELNGFISIPVELARTIIGLPANLVSFRYDLVSKTNELSRAEAENDVLARQIAAELDQRAAANLDGTLSSQSKDTMTAEPPKWLGSDIAEIGLPDVKAAVCK
jgi:hypothetical protein